MKNLLIAFAMVFAIGSSADAADVNVRGYYEFLRLMTPVPVATASTAAISAAPKLVIRKKAASKKRSLKRSRYFRKQQTSRSPRLFKAKTPVYGERCVTSIGSCQINPQPVGSPCQCGNVKGLTLQ